MGPASSTGKQLASKLSLERYLHYFNLWTAHTSSLNLEFNLAQNIVQKIKEMMTELGLSWVEAQFLQNVSD
jgi:ariadne-1